MGSVEHAPDPSLADPLRRHPPGRTGIQAADALGDRSHWFYASRPNPAHVLLFLSGTPTRPFLPVGSTLATGEVVYRGKP